jgi:hypothetical protein
MLKESKFEIDNKYESIKSKLNSKKYSLQFLPECMEELSLIKKISYNSNNLKTSYLIDIIHNLILKYYFRKENRFHLSAIILREKYGHLYNYYIDYLVENGFIVLLTNYRIGRNTRVYSINENIIKNKILRYKNRDNILLKKYKAKLDYINSDTENNLIDKDIKMKLIDDLFNVNIEEYRSLFYLNSLSDSNIDIYNRNKYSVESINDKHIFYHFDKYGRMHTNFTILKSFIRKNCLLINDELTCEIDIKNSQPLFLSKLIEYSKSSWIDLNEFKLFKELTINGIYYDYLLEKTPEIKDRNKAKEVTYKVLFGRNHHNSKSDIYFKNLFPTIHNFIKLYKKEHNDYKVLAYRLQNSESNLIYNKIIREIMNTFPDISIITVHDSIIIPNSYKESVNAIFYTKLYEEFGIL